MRCGRLYTCNIVVTFVCCGYLKTLALNELFYHPDLSESAEQFVLGKDESRHIVKTLRKKPGDKLHITDGRGGVFEAGITETALGGCTVRVTGVERHPALPYRLHLAVAPTKNMSRYEWFVEKATEIGISEITPLFCRHSQRTKYNADRLRKIVISAAKQSQKAWFPILNEGIRFSDFFKTHRDSTPQKYIAHCAEKDKKALGKVIRPGEPSLILIGPEGDFSMDEIESAVQNGYEPVSLGASRLRTETAALVACHSVAFVNH